MLVRADHLNKPQGIFQQLHLFRFVLVLVRFQNLERLTRYFQLLRLSWSRQLKTLLECQFILKSFLQEFMVHYLLILQPIPIH